MSEGENSLTKHKLDLAKELVDDIELSRLAPEQLLLKATRLARLTDNAEIRAWLGFELNGYPDTKESRKCMDTIGRWNDKSKNEGYWLLFVGINSFIASMQIQVQQLKVPDCQLSISSANPNEFVTGFGGTHVYAISGPVNAVLNRLSGNFQHRATQQPSVWDYSRDPLLCHGDLL